MRRDTQKKASRFARVLVDDLVLYNQELVKKAIQEDTVFESLSALFREGKEKYEAEVTPEIIEENDYFLEAIVNKILFEKRNIPSFIWD